MTVPVNPKVLRWVRTSRTLTVEQAAARLKWPQDRVEAVEHAEQITVDDLEALARGYRISTATLLMPDILPEDRYPPRAIDDFRLHARVEQEPLSLKTQMHVETAFELIELFAEVNDADAEVAPRPLLPTCDLDEDPVRVATRERNRIGLALDAQFGWATDKEAFLRWREVLEAEEVIVHKVAMDEEHVRGFAIFRNGYGLVGINSNDDIRARIFTLFHEYAHLLLRRGGVSDQNRLVPIERWCNRFAAAFLMPEAAFRSEYRALFPEAGEPDDWQVARLATRFKTSKSSVAVRFEELGIAAPGFFERLKAEWRLRKRGGGNAGEHDQIDIELGRYGTTHVSAIGVALERGIIDKVEARYALNVPLEHLSALTAAARQRHQAYGPNR
jgi:Zn-dependent peptidase ImmA (M78 family)